MDMIERAARAAIECERNMRGIDIGSPLWGKNIASAVLDAIREPSEAMLEAARKAKFPVFRDGKDHSTLPRWQAMIDTALNPPAQKEE
jgi:hypothetical protein